MQLSYQEGLEMNPEPILISPSRISAQNDTHEPEIPTIIITPPAEHCTVTNLPSYRGLKEGFSRFGKIETCKQAVDDLSAAESLLQLAKCPKRFL
ncbi:hypothetical protein TWF192_004450 [Orbilia oligospora]|uniref:RRM domain-containing protein n=1 Tax=Orbilia oligospora TaxID=2813651 RepID=A0A6G1MDV9_ORBOL|nr:hypothetical protein TWF679_008322 [Orbilia oligospora]KAF3229010.1 hypothetical protein TWF191_002119 [Orbilia oligospora]KAF3252649.1 hypothetical protein TWF192_004450 [Orbilia oligospora]